MGEKRLGLVLLLNRSDFLIVVMFLCKFKLDGICL